MQITWLASYANTNQRNNQCSAPPSAWAGQQGSTAAATRYTCDMLIRGAINETPPATGVLLVTRQDQRRAFEPNRQHSTTAQ